MNIQQALARVAAGGSLTQEEARRVMDQIMSGEATGAQIGGYLIALRMKGETPEEIAGSARAMRDKAQRVQAPGVVVDTCGTGGDGSGTFNISTTTAFVVAGCGVTVAKHGNRSISSRSGSADVLSALGVRIDAELEVVEHCLAKVGIGFLFAPRHHGAMKHAMGPRKELGLRTVFNLLGPLTNPAGAKRQVIGVFDGAWTDPLAKVLGLLGSERALVVHGEDGLDELTITGPTRVAELGEDGVVRGYTVTPEQFGLTRAPRESLQGGDAEQNAAITRAILQGEPGPRREIVLLNAAAALLAAGLAPSLAEGIALAAAALDSGRAMQKLARLAALSQLTPEEVEAAR
ncbi:MAG: anthranilate phosphoribosyltransferase [Magnetococcales bacterium]|nr:anthranilate phosphoribosyltransferase [Magnetococcales bacterium]